MKNLLFSFVLFVLASLCAFGAASQGIYVNDLEGEEPYTLVLSGNGFGIMGDDEKHQKTFRWHEEKVDGEDCVLAKASGIEGGFVFQRLAGTNVLVVVKIAQTDELFEDRDFDDVFENAKKKMTFYLKDGAVPEALAEKAKAKALAEERERAAEIAKKQAEEARRKREAKEAEIAKATIEELEMEPKKLLEMEFVYPNEAIVKEYGSAAFGHDGRMRGMSIAVASLDCWTEDELISLLDKVDWVRGAYLVYSVFQSRTLSSDARRRLAPRVLALAGKVDDVLLFPCYMNDKVPMDVVEEALEKNCFGEKLTKALQQRIKEAEAREVK